MKVVGRAAFKLAWLILQIKRMFRTGPDVTAFVGRVSRHSLRRG